MNIYKAASMWKMNEIKDRTHRRGEAHRLTKKARRSARHFLNRDLRKEG